MIRILFTLVSIFSLSIVQGQTIDFEEFEISLDTFLNGSDANGQFQSQNLSLPNNFDPEFQSWLGWSISSVRDSMTPGFGNQYAAIPASGFEGSRNYAVSFQFGENGLQFENGNSGIEGLYVTNNTYAYLSMRDGDAFAKKFGGEIGDDPDFFLLTVLGYTDGEQVADTVQFYLADYRFEDNSEDYLISEWTYVDLSSLGGIDSLGFSLSSSDNGQFGMNTPAYFCIDQITLMENTRTTVDDVFVKNAFQVYPNPVFENLSLSHDISGEVSVQIYNMLGKLVYESQDIKTKNINVSTLESGSYILQLFGEQRRSSRLFVKQ